MDDTHHEAGDLFTARAGAGGRVYGGDARFLHIPDHHRREVGREITAFVRAKFNALNPGREGDPICPGCMMIAMFDATLDLAQESGQPVNELAATMAWAWGTVDEHLSAQDLVTEEIVVMQHVSVTR